MLPTTKLLALIFALFESGMQPTQAACGSCTSSDCRAVTFSGAIQYTPTCPSGQYGYVTGMNIAATDSDAFSYKTYTNTGMLEYYPGCSTDQRLCSTENTHTCGKGSKETSVVVITCENLIDQCDLSVDVIWACDDIVTAASTTAGNDAQTHAGIGLFGLASVAVAVFYQA